jgi:Zn-dependent protease
MINLLQQGDWALFALILAALVISLSFHEFGHAWVAKRFGDDTAERAGRLTIDPRAHIDPIGLLMVIVAGVGYAKPVPTDPRRFTSRYADLLVAAAGPGMNLLLAVVTINLYALGLKIDPTLFWQPGPHQFFGYLTLINLVLMLFNLMPIGPLDGHYILPYFLPRRLASLYRYYNHRYGIWALLLLVFLTILDVPVFQSIWGFSGEMMEWIALFPLNPFEDQ